MRKNQFLLSLLLLLVSLSASSRNEELLTLKLSNGETVYYNLDSRPVLTFGDNVLTVSTEISSVDYPLSDISNFYFMETTDAIEQIRPNDLQVNYTGNFTWKVSGVKKDKVTVADSMGRIVKARLTETPESTVVSLSHLPKGIYIIKFQQHTLKITKP